MILRQRAIHRLTGLLVRWDMVEHPYGPEYAKQRYTMTGRRRSDVAFESGNTTHSRARTGVVVAALVLASLLATGLLVSA